VSLRDRAIRMLERADNIDDPEARKALLHFVVVGGSYTGVEVAGEFHVFLREAAKRYRRIDNRAPNVTLVEIQRRILPTLDEELADYAAQVMRNRGQELILGDSVKTVHPDRVELASGRVLETHTVVWAAGIAPQPVLGELGLPLDERGYVLCGPDMRVKGFGDVWAAGDCAVNPDPDGNAYPATAQHAVQMGRALARNIVAALQGRSTDPFAYKSKGTLAALGCRTAVAKVGPLKLSGFIAWWLWRTVYMLKMPGLGRKVRVVLDWTLDLFFRRDYVQLGVHRRQAPS
jgi:NADH dehydrogenase